MKRLFCIAFLLLPILLYLQAQPLHSDTVNVRTQIELSPKLTPSLVFSSTNDTNSGDCLLIMQRRLL